MTPLQARAAFDQLEGTLTEQIRAIDARLFDLASRLEASLDFPDEGYHFVAEDEAVRELGSIIDAISALLASAARGRMIREGVLVAIAGRPNAGKSSLFNQLAGVGRAIVAELPGTTRDVLTETIDIDGVPMTIVDTAGVRGEAVDPVEAEGIARAVAARESASLTVLVLDRSSALTGDDHALLELTAARPRVVVANKADLAPAWDAAALPVAAIRAVGADGCGHRVAASGPGRRGRGRDGA